MKKLVGQLKNNIYSVSVLTEPDLELLSNMDPNSVTDITGKDFIEQIKETSGRLERGTNHRWISLHPLNVVSLFYFVFTPFLSTLNR